MKKTKRIAGLVTLAAAMTAAGCSAMQNAGAAPSALEKGFVSPPDDAKPMARWWWFGPAVVKPQLEKEMAAMKAGGFGGFEVQATYPLAVDNSPPGLVNMRFLSPEFLDALKFTSAKAKETGMRMDLTLGSGWPYGGPMFPIGEAAGAIKVTRVEISTGQSSVALPALRDGEKLIAAYAGEPGKDYRELTTKDNVAQIPADLAAAKQVLFFVAGHTGMKVKRPALGAEGYVIDHLSPAVSAKFIKEMALPVLEACAPNPPHAFFCDSLEVYGEDWTDDFFNEFKKRRGYDLRPLLPALAENVGPKTMDIRHDWGQTLTEVYNDAFMKPFHQLAKDQKTRFRIQAYGSPSAGLYSYAHSDLPEGEGYQWHDYRATRYASSASHLMGVPVTSSEAFTWSHNLVFRATPLDVKAEADLHFLQGVNQFIYHGWPYTPPGVESPGWSFYAGGVFNDHNPWWIVMADVNQYLQRVSHLMRQGTPANDVALYLANDDAWSRFTPGKISLTDGVGQCMGHEIVGRILDAGYNLDFFDDQMLERFGKVDNGQLEFGDVKYKVVVLAGVERMPVATMKKLEAFAKAGGTVVATRRMPALAPGYHATDADHAEVAAISQRLFVGANAPGLFVEKEDQFATSLKPKLAPDIAFEPATPQIGLVHRKVGDEDVYFLANTSNAPVTTTAKFRLTGKRLQIWNPLTGVVSDAPVVAADEQGTTVDIYLEPYASTLAVWSPGAPSVGIPPTTSLSPISIDLNEGWTVQFGKDATPAKVDALKSWADGGAMKNYSGIATYTTKLTIPANTIPMGSLVFGPVTPVNARRDTRQGSGFTADIEAPIRDAAVVYINGKRAGSLWCPPYKLDVTPFLVAGENEVRIDVANTAVNAIAAKGFPNYDNQAITQKFGSRFNAPKAEAFVPLPSGLIGKVQLVSP